MVRRTEEKKNQGKRRNSMEEELKPLHSVLSTQHLPADATPAYVVDGLSFSYEASRRAAAPAQRSWALKNLSFGIGRGELLGVIGPNGSGKSSLLKLLARVLHPTSGRIELFGQSLAAAAQASVACTVAFVPQDVQYVFPFSVAEVVLMGRFPHHQNRWTFGGWGWETRKDIRLAEQAIAELDIGHLASRSINEVSGGERQRAFIARALTQQPKVVLLDEPTAFLDLSHQLEICRILRRLNEERGLTVILVSHDLNLASQYCNRLMLLRDGSLHSLGPPELVIGPDILEAVYGCRVIVDRHPDTERPRVTLPGR